MRLFLHAVVIVCALACAGSAFAQAGPQQFQFPNSIFGGGGGGGGSGPFAPIRVIVNTSTTTLTDCPFLKCYYILEMEASSTITLPCGLDGQAIPLKTFQVPPGNFTPTFAACAGYKLNWSGGAPVTPILTSGASQMYSLVVDTLTEPTPVYNEMRIGQEGP